MKKAFTLIELLVATSVFTVVLVVMYSAFQTGIFGYRRIGDSIEATNIARQTLERINLDLRNTIIYSDDETRFTGKESEVTFLTLATNSTLSQDYAFVSYTAEVDPNIAKTSAAGDNSAHLRLMRLCRKNQDALNKESETKADEMATDIKECVFSYFKYNLNKKELEEQDQWGTSDDEKKALPAAVKVKFVLKNEATYTRQIFIPLCVIEP